MGNDGLISRCFIFLCCLPSLSRNEQDVEARVAYQQEKYIWKTEEEEKHKLQLYKDRVFFERENIVWREK